MIENGTVLQDRYLIERRIGAGGMGAVYLAVDQRFGSNVAIKETFYNDEELGKAFEREAHILNSLHHPALPHVSDYFTENKNLFLVMQYIEGEDLAAIMRRQGAFPIRDVLRWTDSLLDALDYLHSQNPPIIHRDIKPQNLKITPRGDVILLDFGLAKLTSDDTTGVKSVFGYSRKYSPLEQIQGTGTDARSDIFSLGATVYHLATGKAPVDVLARAAEIVIGNPDPLQLAGEVNDRVPAGVSGVLNSALALNSAARFPSAKAMREAFQKAAAAHELDNPAPDLRGFVPAASTDGTVISPETAGFPALEAFKAETLSKQESSQSIGGARVIEIPIPPSPPVALAVAPENAAEPSAPLLRRHAAGFRVPLLIVIGVILFGGPAAAYFLTPAGSSTLPGVNAKSADTLNSKPGDPASDKTETATAPSTSATLVPETKKAIPENTERIRIDPSTAKSTVDKKLPDPEKAASEKTNQIFSVGQDTAEGATLSNEGPGRTGRRVNKVPRTSDESGRVRASEDVSAGQSRDENIRRDGARRPPPDELRDGQGRERRRRWQNRQRPGGDRILQF
jgi:Protein kinase domain